MSEPATLLKVKVEDAVCFEVGWVYNLHYHPSGVVRVVARDLVRQTITIEPTGALPPEVSG